MDRKRQLSNVSFGGDWAESILPREEVAAALDVLRAAVARSEEEDPLTPDIRAALARLTHRAVRGPLIEAAFLNAARLTDPGLRAQELARCLRNIERVLGAEVRRP
ncbi:MAG: hypothetical protein H3C60_10430 [Sphingomonadaceae bacterium]|nr:hypothetical protein [Sphingomonadaceae bacterium]